MTRRTGVVAAVLAMLAITLIVVALGMQAIGGPPDVAETLIPLVFVGLGYVVASRVPGNALGWVFLGIATLFAFSQAADSVMFVARDRWGAMSLAKAAAVASSWPWFAMLGTVATFCLLLFPDGRLPSRRWRPVAWAAAAAMVAGCSMLLILTALHLDASVADPYGDLPAPAALDIVAVTIGVLLGAAALASVASLFVRWRRAAGIARQQLKWFALGALVQLLGVVVGMLPWVPGPVAGFISEVTLLAIPGAAALAILRFRLYDIDRILSRTVAWALLTVVLGAVYLAAVTALTAFSSPVTGSSPVAVAAATLVAASAFQPLRRRIQGAVDRRFNRARYDAAQTVDLYRQRLRDELDLETISAGLITTATSTVQPSHAVVWFRPMETRP